ncbi:S26 family signal peptidase [Streptomyces sp. NPDC051771]|uniref:S26 family signal peptidase n=1 Tax=Streptomyces sp. NPDC051771 TaxID=3154847 RepID=UPI003426950A
MNASAAILLAGLPAAGLALLATAAVRGRRRLRVTVSGDSMAPALASGEVVVAHRVGPSGLRTGEVVVLLKPTAPGAWRWPEPTARPHLRPLLVKRLAALPGDPLPPGVRGEHEAQATVPAGYAAVLGDNAPASTDSRAFGLVPLDRVVARLPERPQEVRHRSS